MFSCVSCFYCRYIVDIYISLINLFVPNTSFLYPLKYKKALRFSEKSIENECIYRVDKILLSYNRILGREYAGQKTGYWHNDVFAKIEAPWSCIISRDQ